MPTLRSAAALLAAASGIDGLAALASAIGFTREPAPLAPDDAARLGVPASLTHPHLLRGRGALRALLVEVAGGVPLRETVRLLAGRLSTRTPHLLWIVLAAEREGSGVVLAAWGADRAAPAIAALLCDRRHVVESDAETVCALSASADAVDALTHLRWIELLGREALTRRFYRALERAVHALGESAASAPRATAEECHEIALLHVSRLLFLCFLQSKGWLDADHHFLARTFERSLTAGGGYHARTLLPLFFGTLNTRVQDRAAAARAFGRVPFLNGGLFSRTELERRHASLRFPDELFGALHADVLERHRFIAREERSGWSEAAVDPEMLGKAFESLMASRERRRSGAFYTPQPIVERLTRRALVQALAAPGGSGGRSAPGEPGVEPGPAIAGGPGLSRTVVEALLAGDAPASRTTRAALMERVRHLTILDPACGSGAFLVHVLERLSSLAALLGDPRPMTMIRRDVLTRSIFGVDVNPTAVWLCELRLWLSVVIESEVADPMRIAPLPNLDRHVRVGDTLAGERDPFVAAATGGRGLAALRARYARASGAHKRSLARQLEREERSRAGALAEATIARLAAARREILASRRARDLFGERTPAPAAERAELLELRRRTREMRATLRRLEDGGALPFSFASHFADVADRGGFDMVLGNPPWVRLHNIPPALRRTLRRDYAVFRAAPWTAGAAGAGAGAGFAAQIDLAALFAERSLRLVRASGAVALLLPAKLWRSLAGGGLRALLAEHAAVEVVEDWTDAPPAFDAAVYPSAIVVRRVRAAGAARTIGPHATGAATTNPSAPSTGEAAGVEVVVHTRGARLEWEIPLSMLTLDGSIGSPWLLLPPEVRVSFDHVRAAGVPLAESPFGRPWLGVKCGCNEAFEVAPEGVQGPNLLVASGARTGAVESRLLRPLLRGEDVVPWRARHASRRILWTHASDGTPLATLPPGAAQWLAPWRRRLVDRADARRQARWWRLFRVESAACDRARVVWSDFGRAPRALVLRAGDDTVPLNSCYVARCPAEDDAWALAALLNSTLAASWLHVLAEPARGGYRRYLGWTLALLPIPADWERARSILAPLGQRAHEGEPPEATPLLDAVTVAYGLEAAAVEPLLAWVGRHA